MSTPVHPRPSAAQNKLIDDLGGPAAVVRYVNQHFGTSFTLQMVANWRRRGIPYGYRACLALWANQKNVSVPSGFLNESRIEASEQRNGECRAR